MAAWSRSAARRLGRWTVERDLSPDDEPSYPGESEYLVLARVLLAQGRPDRVLGLLERLHGLAADRP